MCVVTGELLHPCTPGCCGLGAGADRDVSVKRAVTLLDSVVLRALQIPAVNKWTKVEPVISTLAVMASFSGLVCSALRRLCNRRGAADDSDLSDGAQIGAAEDEVKAYRKVTAKRRAKALDFFEDDRHFVIDRGSGFFAAPMTHLILDGTGTYY